MSCLPALVLAGVISAAEAQVQTAAPSTGVGQVLGNQDAGALLQRIADAARTLTYAGTFIHTNPDGATTARITHLNDRGDEWEKLESVDGPRREVIRRNDEMFCFQADSKTMRLDQRTSGKFFPGLIKGATESMLANYSARLGQVERIGGHDCQWVHLEPKDAYRFMQKLCAEVGSGLLLRAVTVNDKKQILEQFTFTQLVIGKDAARDKGVGHLKSRLRLKDAGWSGEVARDFKPADSGWTVSASPPGYRMVSELKRTFTGKPEPMAHLVYSDGLASISVFIEPLASGAAGHTKSSDDGMYSYAMRTIANHQITVLGDVPLSAAQMLANALVPKR